MDGKEITPTPFQKYLMKKYDLNRCNCILAARQSYLTSTNFMYIANEMIKRPINVQYYLHNTRTAKGFCTNFFKEFQHFDLEMKSQNVVESTYSRIEFLSSRQFITRDWTDIMIFDNFAHYKNFDQILNGISELSSYTTSKIIVTTSMRRGFTPFLKFWFNCFTDKNPFQPFILPWDSVKGRDLDFRNEMLMNVGTEYWKSEFECKGTKPTEASVSNFKRVLIEKYPHLKTEVIDSICRDATDYFTM